MERDSEKHVTPLIKGFPSLADFIASDADNSSVIFRRFNRLSARNLLYLQSELAELEAQQDAFDEEDIEASMDEKSTLRDWREFRARAAAGIPRDVERMDLAIKIQVALKEYSEPSPRVEDGSLKRVLKDVRRDTCS